MTLRRHLHRPLLEAIVDLIDDAASPVTLLKCKAHTGLYGNEMADWAAKLAAHGKCDVECDLEPHPFEPLYWPTRKEDEDDDRILYLADLSKGLRAATKETCSLGAAPTDGVYVTAWKETAPHTHGDLSNGFATSSAVGLATKRMVWKARCGLIYNKKLERRYTKQGDGLCPLCGQPDGTRHIISGCKALEKLYTERHNAVGRLVLKAIRKGECGAQVVQHDVGSAAKLAGDGITEGQCARTLPQSTLPDSALQPGHRPRADYRPDITLDWKAAERDEPLRLTPQEITLVEIKVCNDTDPSCQTGRAESQHEELLGILRSHHGRDRVTLVPMMFGATGTIYTSTKGALRQLGVPRQAATRTLAKIHTLLCKQLHAIVGARRAMERTLQPGGRVGVT